MFKDKTILYIVHNYNSFQKDPIEEMAKNFEKVYVLVRYKPLSKVIKFLPFKSLEKYDEKYVIDLKNKPKNVEVIRTPVWYLPFGIFYKWLGEIHFRAVEKAIKRSKIKFDLIHCHFIWSSGYVGMRLKEKYKKPFIVTGHGFDVYQLPFQDKYWKNKTNKILDSADRIFTVSNFNRKFLLKLNIQNKEKIAIISNGVNIKKFFVSKKSFRQELCINEDKKIILSVGNLETVKGQENLILAIKTLVKKRNDIVCYIVGEGSQHRELENLIRDIGIGGEVILVGAKSHEEIRKWMNSCDVFVISSLVESASVVLLEALACGKPVVATRVGIVEEVLDLEDYGFICEVNSVEDLSEKLNKAIQKNWDSKKISKRIEAYNFENIREKILKEYLNLLIKHENKASL